MFWMIMTPMLRLMTKKCRKSLNDGLVSIDTAFSNAALRTKMLGMPQYSLLYYIFIILYYRLEYLYANKCQQFIQRINLDAALCECSDLYQTHTRDRYNSRDHQFIPNLSSTASLRCLYYVPQNFGSIVQIIISYRLCGSQVLPALLVRRQNIDNESGQNKRRLYSATRSYSEGDLRWPRGLKPNAFEDLIVLLKHNTSRASQF